MRARYYDAGLGRFISRDPIGMKDDINLYRYVANNSMKYVDRMGLEKALMTIYSWRENGSLGDGHAWIEVTSNQITHSFGLWPDMFNQLTGEQSIWNGVQIDVELAVKDKRYAENLEQVSIMIDKTKLELLTEEIENNLNDEITWGIGVFDYGVCSTWASDMWNLIAPKEYKLNDRNAFGISNPNSLADSINQLKETRLLMDNPVLP